MELMRRQFWQKKHGEAACRLPFPRFNLTVSSDSTSVKYSYVPGVPKKAVGLFENNKKKLSN